MQNPFTFEAEPFAGYTSFDELESFDDEFFLDRVISGSLGRATSKDSFSPSCDRTVATPSFSVAERRNLISLLSPSKSAQAIQRNRATHPAKSGVRTEVITIDLARYVDIDAVRQAIRQQSGGQTKTAQETEDAVFAEAIHQLQAKLYFREGQHDGVAGASTLDSLGIVKHNLNTTYREAPGRKALKTISGERSELAKSKFSESNWFDNIVVPSFLGHRVDGTGQGIHLLLLRKLREAENYLHSLPAYSGKTPVALGRLLGLGGDTVYYSGGRLKGKSEGMHGLGLALDIDYRGNPWLGAAWNEDDGNSQNERRRFVETLKSATGDTLKGIPKGTTITSLLHSLAEKHGSDTRSVYNVLANWNEAFKNYLRKNESEFKYWNKSATFGDRNPLDGFLNLNHHLVYALRQEAKLAWGAIDFGHRASGDVMHFDMRTLGVGKEVAPKLGAKGAYVPKPGHHPVG